MTMAIETPPRANDEIGQPTPPPVEDARPPRRRGARTLIRLGVLATAVLIVAAIAVPHYRNNI